MLTAPELVTSAPRAGSEPIPNIHVMEDHDGAYDAWTAAGVRDRILVHFDGHLDFYWIADRSPQELLTAQSSEELDRFLSQVTEWNLDEKPLRELVDIGNFIYPAIKEGMVRAFYWVIPDPFWTTGRERRAIQEGLALLIRKRRLDAGPMQISDHRITLTVLGCPLTVCTLERLPHFTEPVLLDLDVDYLVTWKADGPPPYLERQPLAPWLWPSQFLARLKATQLPTDLVTIAYSVNGGFTPLQYKYFGDLLATSLADPNQPIADGPPSDTAAEAYVNAIQALERGDASTARRWWNAMVSRDPSYRSVYATPGWREEIAGRRRSALNVYNRMLQVDPDWHVLHLGMGRVLWRLGRRGQAEEAFERACRLSSGPTSAFHWLGLCAYRRGDWEKAHQIWQKSVEQDPKEVRSWYRLAKLEARRGSPERAIEHAKRCLALGLDVPSVHWLFAWAAWRLRQRRVAHREFRLWGTQQLQAIWARGLRWWYWIRRFGRRNAHGVSTPGSQADASVV